MRSHITRNGIRTWMCIHPNNKYVITGFDPSPYVLSCLVVLCSTSTSLVIDSTPTDFAAWWIPHCRCSFEFFGIYDHLDLKHVQIVSKLVHPNFMESSNCLARAKHVLALPQAQNSWLEDEFAWKLFMSNSGRFDELMIRMYKIELGQHVFANFYLYKNSLNQQASLRADTIPNQKVPVNLMSWQPIRWWNVTIVSSHGPSDGKNGRGVKVTSCRSECVRRPSRFPKCSSPDQASRGSTHPWVVWVV